MRENRLKASQSPKENRKAKASRSKVRVNACLKHTHLPDALMRPIPQLACRTKAPRVKLKACQKAGSACSMGIRASVKRLSAAAA